MNIQFTKDYYWRSSIIPFTKSTIILIMSQLDQ